MKLYKYDAEVYDQDDKHDNDCFHGYVVAQNANEAKSKVKQHYKEDRWVVTEVTLFDLEFIK